MAAGFADADLDVEIDGTLVQPPLRRHHAADDCGLRRRGRRDAARLPRRTRGRPLRGRAYAIEPDASSASYPFALAAALGGAVDRARASGPTRSRATTASPTCSSRPACRSTRGAERRRGSSGSARSAASTSTCTTSRDTVMTLAAIAPLAAGPTRIRNVANIRIKETDRLAATVTELRRLGQHVDARRRLARITPAPITPAVVHCYDDHRIAMSFAILGAAAGRRDDRGSGLRVEDLPRLFRRPRPRLRRGRRGVRRRLTFFQDPRRYALAR